MDHWSLREKQCHVSVPSVMGAPVATVSRYFSKIQLGTCGHSVPASLAAGGSHVVQLCQLREKVIQTISTPTLDGQRPPSAALSPEAEDRGNRAQVE